MIIGLTGSMGSGKSTVVETIEKMGYKHITLSSMVREECRRQGLPEERETLMNIGQKLSEAYGTGVLAERSLEKIKVEGGEKWIIDGIRNPAEIKVLEKNPNFKLIAIHTPREIIVERIFKRGRSDDTLDVDHIHRKLKREWGDDEPEDGQQVGKCFALANYTFENTMSLEEVPNAIRKLHNEIINS